MRRNYKICPVCGGNYPDPPTNKKRFCSADCRKKGGWKTSHGMSRTRLHNIWCGMKSRCKGTASKSAKKYYKDRGIEVCSEWRESFEAFRDWALKNGYQENLEIDRIDNEKGYEPSNCRWATRHQQMINTRTRTNSRKTSRYRGVQFMPFLIRKPWRAILTVNGRPKHIGCFSSEEEAARAFDNAARKLHGEFAATNFKEDEPF